MILRYVVLWFTTWTNCAFNVTVQVKQIVNLIKV